MGEYESLCLHAPILGLVSLTWFPDLEGRLLLVLQEFSLSKVFNSMRDFEMEYVNEVVGQ